MTNTHTIKEYLRRCRKVAFKRHKYEMVQMFDIMLGELPEDTTDEVDEVEAEQ